MNQEIIIDRAERIRKKVRKKDIEIIFGKCPDKCFNRILEVGGGDGFQSTLLFKYAEKVVCTEKDEKLFNPENLPEVEYRLVDVNRLSSDFKPGEFDLIFSSNVLEHLENLHKVLSDSHLLLDDSGIMVHVMPNRLWVFLKISLLPLSYIYNYLWGLLAPQKKGPSESCMEDAEKKNDLTEKKSKFKWVIRFFWQPPHGVSKSNIKEFYRFGKNQWKKLFEKNGFSLLRIKKLQFHSPHRFGFEGLRRLFTWFGLCSTYAFILSKRGKESPMAKYFC